MNKLSEDELLKWLKENIDRFAFLQISHPHLAYYATKRDKQAYQQIKEMIRAYAEHQELTANYIDIVIDLYDQLEQKKPEVNRVTKSRIRPERMNHMEIGVAFGKPIKQPEVTEEFVEKWADKFDGFAQESLIIDIDLIKQMLKEAGVEVKEEK